MSAGELWKSSENLEKIFLYRTPLGDCFYLFTLKVEAKQHVCVKRIELLNTTMHQVSTLGLLLTKICYNIRLLEAATGGILQKKLFLKFLQN